MRIIKERNFLILKVYIKRFTKVTHFTVRMKFEFIFLRDPVSPRPPLFFFFLQEMNETARGKKKIKYREKNRCSMKTTNTEMPNT